MSLIRTIKRFSLGIILGIILSGSFVSSPFASEKWETVENFFSDKTFATLQKDPLHFPFEAVCRNLAGTGEFILSNFSPTSKQEAHEQGTLGMIALMGLSQDANPQVKASFILDLLTNSQNEPTRKAQGVTDDHVQLHQAILILLFSKTMRQLEESQFQKALNKRLQQMNLKGFTGEQGLALFKERVIKKYGLLLQESIKKYMGPRYWKTSIGMDIENPARSVQDILGNSTTNPRWLDGQVLVVDKEGVIGTSNNSPLQPGRVAIDEKGDISDTVRLWGQQTANYLKTHSFKKLDFGFWDGKAGHTGYSFLVPLADIYRLSNAGKKNAALFLQSLKEIGKACKDNKAILNIRLSQGFKGTREYVKMLPIGQAVNTLTYFGDLDVTFYGRTSEKIIGSLAPIASQIKGLTTDSIGILPLFIQQGVQRLNALHITQNLPPQEPSGTRSKKFLEGLQEVKDQVILNMQDLSPLAYLSQTPLRPQTVTLRLFIGRVTEKELKEQLKKLKPLKQKFTKIELTVMGLADRVDRNSFSPIVQDFIGQFSHMAKTVTFTFYLGESENKEHFQANIKKYVKDIKARIAFEENNSNIVQTFTVAY